MDVIQNSFISGMDQISNETAIADDGYQWLVNGRNRYRRIQVIPKHVEQNLPSTGKLQEVFIVGNVIFLFQAGKAYYRIVGDTAWNMVLNLQLDSNVDRIYSCAVPATGDKFSRNLDSSGDVNAPIKKTVDINVQGIPSGIIVQDGINQPWFITENPDQTFSGRVTQNYSQWSNIGDKREYVPIGLQTIFINGITFIVAPDRNSIYRSVSGRPLDFMVAVDTNGDKLPDEQQGGAPALSFSFDFDDITYIGKVNLQDSFIYATLLNTRIVTFDYTNTIYGEPRFISGGSTIPAGVVNTESFVEALGDYCMVGPSMIVSFNAVQQFRFVGRNSIFSKNVAGLLKDFRQISPAAIEFDNFLFFSVQTAEGKILLVYDNLTEKWVSKDITEVFDVKKFSVFAYQDELKLYALTRDNKLWEMFANTTESYNPILVTRAFAPDRTKVEHKSQMVRAIFSRSSRIGTAVLTEYVDNKLSGSPVEKSLTSLHGGVAYPVIAPVIVGTLNTVDPPTFQVKNGLGGRKIWYSLVWDNDAELEEFEFMSTELPAVSALKDKAQTI